MRSPIAALTILIASPAFAETTLDRFKDDSELAEEGEEETETTFKREGFAIGVGFGVAGFSGSGEQSHARSAGGSLALRLGTSAGENLLWFLQLDLATYEKKSGASLLGIGAHYYFRERLWARGGLALANAFTTDMAEDRISEGGLAIVAGAGADVYRRGIFAIDVELGISRSSFPDGSLSLALFQVMANWY